MKTILALFLAAALLSSCGAGSPEALSVNQTEPASVPEETEATELATEPEKLEERDEPDEQDEPEEPEESEPDEEEGPAVFVPDHPLTIDETIEAYFREMYRSYLTMEPVDITSILWLEEWAVKNSIVWSEMLAMRRRLIDEHDLCYVETEKLPYKLQYIDESELVDERLAVWEVDRPPREGEEYHHFVVTGEAGRAYPPFLAVNAQHTIRLIREDGVWKITLHYFPGSVRKWIRSGMLAAPEENKMLLDLINEFGPSDSGYPDESGGGTPYDPGAAVDYALRYTESPNPEEYHAGEWLGNCQNFISQSVSAGFGGAMTASWYAGGGGGSPAWENVRYFWDWITGSGEARGHVLGGMFEIREGDLIQTDGGPYRRTGGDPPGSFSHCLLVVDEETLLLAQNTPACFVLYSDLVNVETRIVRPVMAG